jgi:tetratricopeptide (TPR) repeat protein
MQYLKSTAGKLKLAKNICLFVLSINLALLCIIYALILPSLFMKWQIHFTDIQIYLIGLPSLISALLLNLIKFAKCQARKNACNLGNSLFVWGHFEQAINAYDEALSIETSDVNAQKGKLMCLQLLLLREQQIAREYERCQYN